MNTERTRSTPFASLLPWRPLAVACVLAYSLLLSACAAENADIQPVPDMGNVPSDQSTAPAADMSSTVPATVATTDGARQESASATRGAELAALAGADGVTVIEDWADFDRAEDVEATIARNLGMGENAMTLSLSPARTVASYSGDDLVMAYEIRESPPHDFVGFNRDLDPPADWSGATRIALWIDASMAAEVNVVFQFRETSGEVWRHQGAMPTSAGGALLVLPFDTDAFTWASWSTTENGTPDLGAVDQYGVYVGHAGPGRSGVVHLGPIALIE